MPTKERAAKQKAKQFDSVNRPQHYADGNIEAIDFFKDKLSFQEFQGFLKGNAMKYLIRATKKSKLGPTEDYRKAQWYVNKLVEHSTKN